MTNHKETRVLAYTPQQLFDLVAAVERYPEFIPWCKAARVIKRTEDMIIADLIIGYKMFNENFTSEVELNAPHNIAVRYMSGPLSHLHNQWQFKPYGKNGCELTFHVDFDFRSSFLRSAMEMFFDKALLKMVSAFEQRAGELYGKK